MKRHPTKMGENLFHNTNNYKYGGAKEPSYTAGENVN
jgi:hypothetical protein